MATHKTRELPFEEAIEKALLDRGWVNDSTSPTIDKRGWNIELALHEGDVLEWLYAQYPAQMERAIPEATEGAARTTAENRILTHLSGLLGKPAKTNRTKGGSSGGLMGVIRDGFDYMHMSTGKKAKFGPMVVFPPANPVLEDVTERSEQVRLRVLRQVRFDTTSSETLDIVLLANGIPVVTMELKTDNVQSVEDAKTQYKLDRVPGKNRTLLQPGRVLVHFAVSNSEVAMTTRLAGKDTYFLPFNAGNNGHAGNAPNPHGSESSYLWEKVLERRQFLSILQDFAVWKPSSKKGAKDADGNLIFPRYHQLRAVERLDKDIRDQEPGQRYLIQHSAGSGKTMTISWLAHRLSTHHTGTTKTFDSVIVISDRTVLDRNLRDGLQLLPRSEGLVVNIGSDAGAKSDQLAEALTEGGHIISCTLQTFPELLTRIQGDKSLGGRSWCVIIDEAHSSQTGASARALRQILGTQTGDEDPGEADLDTVLAATDSAVAGAANTTFVAFTATPKAKTLRLFGTQIPGEERWVPFDEYSMAQAIEEEFILDVLVNYTTYDMMIQVADQMGRTELVERGEVVGEIVRFARSHPETIRQKAEVVVEHFRTNVMHLLAGQARAMVVTSSRQDAVTWSKAMNSYIADRGWGHEFRTLVAFSGDLEVPGRGKVTERDLNKERDVETAFKDAENDYRVLIVADKFQTGFDEPRLMAMYVDKVLSGVATVQTLSRLNRTYEVNGVKKSHPMVLDFVNNPESILDDFKLYYSSAELSGEVDVNNIFEVAERLDDAGIYTEEDIDAVAEAYYDPNVGHEDFRRRLSPLVDAWKTQLADARRHQDQEEIDRLLEFRVDLRTYLKSWQFASQIVDFDDSQMHKRAILAAYLMRNLTTGGSRSVVDIAGVDVIGIEVAPDGLEENLGLSDGDSALDVPTFGGRTAGEGSPEQLAFDTAVDEANEILQGAGIDISYPTQRGFISVAWGTLAKSPTIRKLASENNEHQVASAPLFSKEVDKAILSTVEQSQALQSLYLQDPDSRDRILHALAGIAVAAAKEPDN